MMLVRIFDLGEPEAFDKTVECSAEEWNALTAEARAGRQPIDGATVDTALLETMMERPARKGRAKHRIPLV